MGGRDSRMASVHLGPIQSKESRQNGECLPGADPGTRPSVFGSLSQSQAVWIIYDSGHFSFTTVMVATMMPIRIKAVAAAAGLSAAQTTATWGFCTGLAAGFAALGAPILGGIADSHGCRKQVTAISACCAMTTALCFCWLDTVGIMPAAILSVSTIVFSAL